MSLIQQRGRRKLSEETFILEYFWTRVMNQEHSKSCKNGSILKDFTVSSQNPHSRTLHVGNDAPRSQFVTMEL
ncbi:hypothetical protein BELL_0212g00170 [Botrytis elliptica]|uniref:Uncharacterized protein n=1 Tax=Botrytis elliptica TaxID=278938 RepID=A0A4Z1JPE5_9HELO|nr:hypothetical protein BELL_0212g00170 [Botrytis elliptica]